MYISDLQQLDKVAGADKYLVYLKDNGKWKMPSLYAALMFFTIAGFV